MSHKQALTIGSTSGILRILKSAVGVSLPFLGDEATQKDIPIKKFEGIWDTGATGTVITKKVVEELDLKPTGQTDVYTAKGKATTNTYLVNIYLPMNVTIQGVTVTEGDLSPDIQLLIGMDIITLGDFSITHKDGNTKMSFGVPPYESIDYVKRINDSKPKVGRNDDCPCGSGKKYKKCHGNGISI